MNTNSPIRSNADRDEFQLCRCAVVAALVILALHLAWAASLAEEMPRTDEEAQFSAQASLLADLPDDIYYSRGPAGKGLSIEFKGCDAATVHKGITLLRRMRIPLSIEFQDGVPLSSEDCDDLANLESLTEMNFAGALVSGANLTRLFSNSKSKALVRLTLPEKSSFGDSDSAPIFPASLRILALNGSSLPGDTWKSLVSANKLTNLYAIGAPLQEEAWMWIDQMKQLRNFALEIAAEDDAAIKRLVALRRLEELVIDGGTLDYDSAMDLSWSLLKCNSLSLLNMSLDEGVVAALSSLPALRQLRVAACDLHTSNVSDLSKFAELQGLSLAASCITPDGVVRLPTLRHLELLDLTATEVDYKTITALSAMESLRLLNLNRTAVTDDMMEHITALPHLTALNMHATLITDKGVEVLMSCNRLEQLNLRDTQVTPKSLAVLATLPALKAFGLTGVSMKGATFKEFQGKHIESLYLRGCDINDDMLVEILKLPNLKALDISRNPEVTSVSAERILNHPSLDKVSVEGCNVNKVDLRRLKSRFQTFERETVEFEQR